MKSPFPGMDPYLEPYWNDVHVSLLVAIKEALQPILPRALRARAEEQVMLESPEGEPLSKYRPDVAVVEHGAVARGGAPVARRQTCRRLTPSASTTSLRWIATFGSLTSRTVIASSP